MLDKMMVTKLITEVLPGNYQYYRESLQQMEENFNVDIAQGSKLFIKYDEDFHDSLIKLSNNSRLISIYADNRIQTKTFRQRTSLSEERIEYANKLYKELLASIKNMDLVKQAAINV